MDSSHSSSPMDSSSSPVDGADGAAHATGYGDLQVHEAGDNRLIQDALDVDVGALWLCVRETSPLLTPDQRKTCGHIVGCFERRVPFRCS